MNCVYNAWRNAIRYLEVVPEEGAVPDNEFLVYEFLKELAQGREYRSQPTDAVVALEAIRYMSTYYPIRFQHQHTFFERCHYIDLATKNKKHVIRWWAKNVKLGFYVKEITLAPAIYLCVDTQHAVFAETVPGGKPVIAIKITKE